MLNCHKSNLRFIRNIWSASYMSSHLTLKMEWSLWRTPHHAAEETGIQSLSITQTFSAHSCQRSAFRSTREGLGKHHCIVVKATPYSSWEAEAGGSWREKRHIWATQSQKIKHKRRISQFNGEWERCSNKYSVMITFVGSSMTEKVTAKPVSECDIQCIIYGKRICDAKSNSICEVESTVCLSNSAEVAE